MNLLPPELVAPLMFASMVGMLLLGFPVALTLVGHGFFWLCLGTAAGHYSPEFLYAIVLRVNGIPYNDTLLAIPFFTLMGMVLERSGLAQALLSAAGELLDGLPGGLALAVVGVGTLLAVTTGVVQASIIAMGVVCLPAMLARGYRPSLACGVIVAAGTLAQLIPPSLVLVVLAEVTGVPVFQMYERALAPGLVLAGLYASFIMLLAWWRPALAPAGGQPLRPGAVARCLRAMLPPLILIAATLGSMLAGVATPTESGAFGAVAALLLAAAQRRLGRTQLREVVDATLLISTCAMFILVGAHFFILPFRGMEGTLWIESWFRALPGGTLGFLLVVNMLIFVLAFFLDFFEIAFIVLPLVMPVVVALGIDPAWFAVLVCITLQTSFMHPPFGIAIYSLRSVAPASVRTRSIYLGALPFIGLQLLTVGIVIAWPQLAVPLGPPPPAPMAPQAVIELLQNLPHPDFGTQE